MTELSRSLKPRHVTMISIGGIIGAGLFVGSSAAIAATGPAVIFSYLLAGTLVLFVMQMLGEMAVALPRVRSFTEFARAGLGDWAGFVAGWLYWYFWIIVIPVEAIAGANLLQQWLALPGWLLGLGLMTVMAGVNLMSARSYGEFEFWFSSIKVAAIIVFILLAGAYAAGWVLPPGPGVTHLTGHGGFMPRGVLAVLAAVVTVFFALTGAEITTVAAAESSEPAKMVAQMSRSVIVRILTFYVISIFLVVCVVPWSSVQIGESPFALALTSMRLDWASRAISVIILTAVLSCLNSAFYVCSRVLFVLAGHGDAPQWLVHLNARAVPARSVCMGWVAGMLGIVAQAVAPDTVFAFLVNASGALMIFVYLLTVVAHWRLRRQWVRLGHALPPARTWWFPWSSGVCVFGMLAVLVAMGFTEHARELYASFASLLIVLGSHSLVRLSRRRRAEVQRVVGSTAFLLLLLASFPALSAAPQAADLVICCGKVLTVDAAFSVKSAVAVKDGKIIAVGGEEITKQYAAPRSIDLKGRVLLPGFMDTHIHMIPVSRRDVELGDVHSIGELQERVRRKARELGPGEWVSGFGWDEAKFREQRNPVREDLDVAAPDNPVLLIRAGGHSAVANSRAMRLAGVVRDTPDPPGGLIEHEASGEPNGIVRERYQMIQSKIPPPSWAELRPSYIARLKDLLPMGITSIMEASGSIDDEPVGEGGIANPSGRATWHRYQQIYAELGTELPRMALYINYPGAQRLKAFPHHTGYGDERLRIGPIGESAVDGGFTGPTAWTLADYKGMPGFRGKGRYTDQELQELVDTSGRLGWQLGVHTIGDAAIVQAVNAYSKAIRAGLTATKDHRWFLDHFTVMPPDATMNIMAADHIALSQQPNFTYTLEGRYVATLDDWRVRHTNSVTTPWKKHGLFVAFGSDNLPIGPMVGLYTAVTRKGSSGKVYGAEEAVDIQDAIRMYTANGPHLTFEDKIKGSLEVDKLADMIVLDADPTTIAPERLLRTKVDLTIIGGRVVFDRLPER